MHKFWQQHELWDGTYSFRDWLHITDAILVHDVNKARVSEYYSQKR